VATCAGDHRPVDSRHIDIQPEEASCRGHDAAHCGGHKEILGDYAVPFLAVLYGTGGTRPLDRPFPAVTASGAHHALAEPFILKTGRASGGDRTQPASRPLSAVMTKAEHCVVSSGNLDIRFRMLSPGELKLAQGFPGDYIIMGNSAEQFRQIGNAVPVNTAKALIPAAIKQETAG